MKVKFPRPPALMVEVFNRGRHHSGADVSASLASLPGVVMDHASLVVRNGKILELDEDLSPKGDDLVRSHHLPVRRGELTRMIGERAVKGKGHQIHWRERHADVPPAAGADARVTNAGPKAAATLKLRGRGEAGAEPRAAVHGALHVRAEVRAGLS